MSGVQDLTITVLGSGTSVGVPVIGCKCAVCHSTDPRDKRLRPSVVVQYNGKSVLIDTTPDFRAQALRAGLERVDAILFTHEHADHIMGLDDVRPFNFRQGGPIPIYGSAHTLESIRRVFGYIFEERKAETSIPKLVPHPVNIEPFELFGIDVVPIPLQHGKGTSMGYRFGPLAYLTDHSEIPDSSLERLHDLEVLFLDALRHRPHPTHSTIQRSLNHVALLKPKRAFFTHICCDLSHARTEEELPSHVRLAFDGLRVEITRPEENLRVYRSLEAVPSDFGPSAITIGNFDGVHAGHQSLMSRVTEVASENGWKPSVLTFDPHPTQVVAPSRTPPLMTTIEERCRLMARDGIQQVLVLPFTSEVASWPPEEFVRRVLVEALGAKAIIVGHNFRFGHRQEGDIVAMHRFGTQFGFSTEVLRDFTVRSRSVSSTAIRMAVQSGDMGRAGRMLGRPFSLVGDVVAGHGIGSKQTVPTLNLAPDTQVIPARGVYVTRTSEEDGSRSWESVSNIGFRPTFNGDSLSIETFLLSEFDGRSPKRIRVEFLMKLREERKFETPSDLKRQILRDVVRAKKYFHRWSRWHNRETSHAQQPELRRLS